MAGYRVLAYFRTYQGYATRTIPQKFASIIFFYVEITEITQLVGLKRPLKTLPKFGCYY